jgi:hypothetical protein
MILAFDCRALYLPDFCRLGAFSAFSGFVLDAGGVIKRSVAFPVNVGVMDEEIVAPIVRGNKAIPLLIIKPLYRTCCHLFLLMRFNVEA